MFIKVSDLKDGVEVYHLMAMGAPTRHEKDGVVTHSYTTRPTVSIEGFRIVGEATVTDKNVSYKVCALDDKERSHVYDWNAPVGEGYVEYHYPSRDAALGFFNIVKHSIDNAIGYGQQNPDAKA